MGNVDKDATLRIPTQEIVREAADRLFGKEASLRVESMTWRYRIVPEKGVAAAKFSLSDGKQIVFSNVLFIARYHKRSTSRIEVQASISGLTPMHREYYVLDENLPLTSIEEHTTDWDTPANKF